MKNLHAKSPCCGAQIQRYGQRRRRCGSCHKTWRIRHKKRGRKTKRVQPKLIIDYLEKKLPPLRILARRKGGGKDAIQVSLRQSLKYYVRSQRNKWRLQLRDQVLLIAVADAIWYRIKGQRYTIYIILLRPLSWKEAIICPPIVLPGHEGRPGWKKAFDSLSIDLKTRLKAVVCDGAISLVTLIKDNGWLVQRCHFHLLAAVQNYLTTSSRSIHQEYAWYVMSIVQKLIQTNKQSEVKPLIKELRNIIRQSSSRGLRRVLKGLITNLTDYHAYLRYPDWCLPTTSNSAESFIQCLRDLMYRCRGFRSLTSLMYWLKAAAIFKKTIVCNGKKSTKLNH